MRTSVRPASFLLALLLLVAACGGSDSSSTAGGGPLRLSGAVSSLAGAATSTVAGGPPVLGNPRDVVRLGESLYVAVTGSNMRAVKRVSLADGAVSTLANVAVDALATDGTDLYGVSYDNRTACRISPDTGEVTELHYHVPVQVGDNVLVGTLYLQCRGVAVAGGSLYVADTAGSRILRMAIDNGEVSTFAGGGGVGSADGTGSAARFHRPQGLSTDGTHLYVADTGGQTIRKVDISTGRVTTLAGSYRTAGSADGTGSGALFNDPGDVVVDGECLYVADTRNHTVRKVVIATGEVTTVAGSPGAFGTADGTGNAARFNRPTGVDTDGTDLFVADSTNGTVRRVSIATGAVSTEAGTPGAQGFADGTGGEARFSWPDGMATVGTSLYVADSGNHTIRKVSIATGEVSTVAGLAGTAGFVDATGEKARFWDPAGIATDGWNLYVTDRGNNSIRKVVIATGEVTTLAGDNCTYGTADGTGSEAEFNGPTGIALAGGYLYVADSQNHTIRRVSTATGEVTTFVGDPGLPGAHNCGGGGGTFNLPSHLATDGTNLFVADSGNFMVRKVVIATRVVTTLAGSYLGSDAVDGTGGEARFVDPYGVTTDGTYVYVSDGGGATIRKVSIATGAVTTVAGSPWVTDYVDGTGSAARFNVPGGLATDGTSLFVADTGNHTIRVVR